MAYEHIDKAETIGGAAFRSTEKKDGYWTDPFTQQEFYSVTYMPELTRFEEDQEEGEMLKKIKNKKFKASDLSESTKQKFRDEKISFENNQDEDENDQ